LAQSVSATAALKIECPFVFPIDPTLANAIRDDCKRFAEFTYPHPPALTAEETRLVRERIAERAKTISCPHNYGFRERWDDWARLFLRQTDAYIKHYARVQMSGVEDGDDGVRLGLRQIPGAYLRHHIRVPMYDVEDGDAEEAQAIARIMADKIDKSVLTIAEPKRIRNKAHLKFVASQPCAVCGRQPSDPHHLRFAQPRAIGLKVSDEFAVPLCRGHHRQLHQAGNEIAWWQGLQINALEIAKILWEKTRAPVERA